MKTGKINRASKGQAMTEFVFMAFVAFIVLFVAVQMAALGREYMALGQLSYQVTRWATNPGNNSLKDSSGNAINSPQCTDVANLIAGTAITAGYSKVNAVATGYMGKIGYNNTVSGALFYSNWNVNASAPPGWRNTAALVPRIRRSNCPPRVRPS